MSSHYETIDQYIRAYPGEVQERLDMLRRLVHETVPEVEESISYQMPAFRYKGKILLYFAAYSNHIGVYATPRANEAYADQLATMGFKTSKGTIQLPFNKPIPVELLCDIARFKASSIEEDKKAGGKL
ncbi:MAG: hypothetical protein GX371_03870 [Bacteroidales bacterium]|nr:hypothetical protein [Bacteroidales bacterium]